jgi:hypothetical protein
LPPASNLITYSKTSANAGALLTFYTKVLRFHLLMQAYCARVAERVYANANLLA